MRSILIASIAIAFVACEYTRPTKEISADPKIRAMELNDSAVDLMQSSAVFYADGAVEVLYQSIALDSTYDKPWANMAGIYMQKRNFNAALKAISELEKLKPNSPDLHMTKGLLYSRLNDQLNAEAEYQFALDSWNNSLSNLDTAGPAFQDMSAKRLTALLLLNRTDQVLEEFPNADTSFDDNKDLILAEFWKAIPMDER